MLKTMVSLIFLFTLILRPVMSGEVVVGHWLDFASKEITLTRDTNPPQSFSAANPNLSYKFMAIREEGGKIRVLVRDGEKSLGTFYIDHNTYEEAFYGNLMQSVSNGLKRSSTMVTSEPCSPSQDTTAKKIESMALQGARKVFANFFQSCAALEEKITKETPLLQGVSSKAPNQRDKSLAHGIKQVRQVNSTEQLVESNIFMQKALSKGDYPQANCKDMRPTPPIYAYGGKAKFQKDPAKINLFQSNAGVKSSSRNNNVSIDCSGFISAAFATMGLKIEEDKETYTSYGTTTLKDASEKKNTCLPDAQIEPTDILRPGDVFNYSASHVVMIDEIGEDPLAVERFARINQCNDITIDDFDFTYLHSGAINNSYGPSRVHINAHGGEDAMMNGLRSLAIKMCQNLVEGENSPIDSKKAFPNKRFSLMRHDSERESCHHEPVPLEGEECLENCPYINQQTGTETEEKSWQNFMAL